MQGGGEKRVSQPMSTAVHRSPNKLRRSSSIFNLCRTGCRRFVRYFFNWYVLDELLKLGKFFFVANSPTGMELYGTLVCRDYAGKRPRQYMVQADSNTSLSLSSDTFRNRGIPHFLLMDVKKMPLTSETTGPLLLPKKVMSLFSTRRKTWKMRLLVFCFKACLTYLTLLFAVPSWCRYCGSLCFIIFSFWTFVVWNLLNIKYRYPGINVLFWLDTGTCSWQLNVTTVS